MALGPATPPEREIPAQADPAGAASYEAERQGWDHPQEETLAFPSRPRRQFVTRGSMALLGVVLCAIGFYAGVRVEKGQLANSSSTATPGGTGRGAFASRFGGGAGAGAGPSAGASASGRSGGGGGGGGFASAISSGNAAFGTVSSIDGKTLYITQATTGNVIKVNLSGATKITKNVSAGKSAIRPGDTVIVQGLKGSNGAITAASVSDTGASAGVGAGAGFGGLFGGGGGAGRGAGGGGSGGGGGGSGGGSAINQLFGGGGAGR